MHRPVEIHDGIIAFPKIAKTLDSFKIYDPTLKRDFDN